MGPDQWINILKYAIPVYLVDRLPQIRYIVSMVKEKVQAAHCMWHYDDSMFCLVVLLSFV